MPKLIDAKVIRDCCKQIFKPKPTTANVHWVGFKNGTIFVIKEDPNASKDSLIGLANNSIAEFAGVGSGAGSFLGDFAAHQQLPAFPDGSVWIVTFDSPSIMGLVVTEEGESMSDLSIGLHGRNYRALDADNPVVIATSLDE
ncbi:hypothetical protein BC833DRAFT_193215 [Globomyces pollinis-pini]|nr:hypothetical protein BC833DRAFT_193215 [Globomyces pollinis-pini]KAJ2994529.1 hypothetical protein HDV02_001507 [Globomyces sp. JEL0801]